MNNIIIVLERPKSLVNIAGVVRVMMNTGLSRLRVIEPDDYDADRIGGIAHRGAVVTDHAEVHDGLAEALADCTYVVGTSARARAVQIQTRHPRAIAPELLRRAADGPVAIMFGREDRGLGNEAIDRCNEVVVIPTADFSSLNLAQAAMVVCYELLMSAEEYEPESELGKGKKARATELATQGDLDAMYAALERGLDQVDFFRARDSQTVLRTMRSLIGRAVPTQREARLVQAMGARITKFLRHHEIGEEE